MSKRVTRSATAAASPTDPTIPAATPAQDPPAKKRKTIRRLPPAPSLSTTTHSCVPTSSAIADSLTAANASFASQYLQIHDLRQALFRMLDRRTLARFGRVDKAMLKDAMGILYEEVDFTFLRTKMGRVKGRKAIYYDAVRRVIFTRDWETPALKKEAKTTDWVALGHPKAMRAQEKEVLAALALIRAKCPNVHRLVLHEGTVTLTLTDDDTVGEYTGPDTYELRPTPYGQDEPLAPRRRGFCSPFNGFSGYKRTVTSIDLSILQGADITVTSLAHLPAPIGSITHACDRDGMPALLALPQLANKATGEAIRSLHTITLQNTMFSDAVEFTAFAQAFADAPLRNLYLAPSRRQNNMYYPLPTTEMYDVFVAIARYLPLVKRLEIDIAWTGASGIYARDWDMDAVKDIKLEHLELRAGFDRPGVGERMMDYFFQCSKLLAEEHTVRVFWSTGQLAYGRDVLSMRECERALSAFRRMHSFADNRIDPSKLGMRELGVLGPSDISHICFDNNGEPIPVIRTLIEDVLADSTCRAILEKEPELQRLLEDMRSIRSASFRYYGEVMALVRRLCTRLTSVVESFANGRATETGLVGDYEHSAGGPIDELMDHLRRCGARGQSTGCVALERAMSHTSKIESLQAIREPDASI